MAQASRTFRIFVSSTFNDLKAERNALQDHVYPMLKELCERHETRFQAIDLRWGVSEEAANDQQTINICLTEVDRCRDTSPKPNFIVLLGDRYGWRPPPPQIDADEFKAVREEVSKGQQARLDEWYVRDENAVPPEYRLREREGEEEEDSDKWEVIERELTEALRNGAPAAGLRDERLQKYVASATEQEIDRGALTVADAPDHVFCFFREIDNLDRLIDDIPDAKPQRPFPDATLAEDFVDLRHPETDRRPDTDAGNRLAALKAHLRAKLPDNIHEYEASWTGGGITTGHIGSKEELPEDLDGWLALRDAADRPRNLCVDIWLRLSGVILAEIAKLEREDELDREIAAHESFGKARARFFVPRFFTTGENALDRIAAYVGGGGTEPLAVAGLSGAGKSALMAKAAQEAARAHPEAAVVRRFIGATPTSADGRALLESLCQEISRRYRQPDASAPADYRELVEELPNRLALATTEQPLFLFLDALDQLSDAEGARNLAWLPISLPPNVSLVVSALRADPASEAPPPKGSECLTTLEAKLPGGIVDLQAMTREEGAELLDLWLEDAGRRLKSDQRDEVLSKFAAEEEEHEHGLPLYLKLAFEEARRWHSDSDPGKARVIPGIHGIIRGDLFARLSRDENHGEVIVSHSLGYLGAAKNGLSEDELLGVLSEQKDVLEDFAERNPRSPPVTQLPVIVWSRLYFDLEPYLGERSADGVSLLTFYHRQLGQVVEEDYLAGDKGRDRHRELAEYFEPQPLVRETAETRAPNLRKMAELPYQQAHGDMWDELFGTLTNFEFLERKAADYGVVEAGATKTYTGVYSLQEDYALALDRMPGSSAGGQRRIIVTGTDFGDGLQIRCPHCNEFSDFEDGWRGRDDIDCQRCGGPWKVNDFFVERSR